ncbi:uncharacterized protein LOC142226407 isoform X1 [Haematobia irritans]|uniref:uncharacterized protein LOC142226407 isoform X1 n=1 Tax=Haematobia irritans TaxID=7368 RepID=UPI003F4FDF9E
MPPKSSSKKSANKAAAIWYYCENCEAHITANDRDGHEQICLIGDGQTETEKGESIEYIRRGIFYTSSLEVRKFEIESLKEMPQKYLNNLIYLSEGAMRLSGLHIGQEILISSNDKVQHVNFIRNVWPIPDKFLTTVFINDDDYKNNWLGFKGHMWQIQALPKGQPITAKSILLQILTEDQEKGCILNSQQISDLERLLKFELKNLCFVKDSLIKYDFFNKSLKLKVLNAASVCEDNACDLDKAFDKLSLDKNINRGDIFKITISTDIRIIYENIKTSDETSDGGGMSHLITTDDIGGLSKQLEIIEESMDFALGLRAVPKAIKNSSIRDGDSNCTEKLKHTCCLHNVMFRFFCLVLYACIVTYESNSMLWFSHAKRKPVFFDILSKVSLIL